MGPRYQASDVRRVAREFSVHERTVTKVLAGIEVAGISGERARSAAAALRARAGERAAATDDPRTTAATPTSREASAA